MGVTKWARRMCRLPELLLWPDCTLLRQGRAAVAMGVAAEFLERDLATWGEVMTDSC